MANFSPFRPAESFLALPPDENLTSHPHGHGRRSHNDECVPLHSLTDWDQFCSPGAFHSDLHQSHTDDCLHSHGCFVTGSLDGSPFAPVLFPPRQDLSSEHSRSSTRDSQPAYGSIDEDDDSQGTQRCGSRCSNSGTACEDACEEVCKEPCEDACIIDRLCDPNTFCTEENCSKPQIGHDVAHGATILQGISVGKHSQQLIDPNLQASYANSSSTYSYASEPFQFGFQDQDAFVVTQMQGCVSSDGQHHLHAHNASTSQNYTQHMGFSQTSGQSQTTPLGYSAQYTSTSILPQAMNMPEGLEAGGDLSDFHLDADYNQMLSNGFDQSDLQHQTHWNAPMPPPPMTSFSSQGSNPFYTGLPQDLSTSGPFDFNTERDGQHAGQMYRQHSHKTSDKSDYMATPSDHSLATPSMIMSSMADTPSPMTLTQTDGIHECQWQVDGHRICELICDNVQELNDHIHNAHVKDLQPVEKDGYVCQWAGCTRQTSSQYKDKRGFDGKSKLKRHICTHAGSVATFTCSQCFKECGSAQALRTHKVTHSTDRPFVCDVVGCEKNFKTQDSLKVHKQNAHSTKKRYTCEHCGKAFKDSSNFSKHKKTHINTKEWKCNKCGETFARRDQLFRHAGRIHSVQPETLEMLYPRRVRGGAHARRVSVDMQTASLGAFSTPQTPALPLMVPAYP